MCRWMAYRGGAIPLDELLLKTKHSLVEQSLHSTMGATTTNGDGFGVGWFGKFETPGVYRSFAPAWNDANLRNLTAHIESPMFLAHVRAATGTPIQSTNCHPFSHGRWLFVHNGMVAGFPQVKRDLLLRINPEFIPDIEGSTDSEILFMLARTNGLDEDPVGALELMAGTVEEIGAKHGIAHPLQMTVCVADGRRLVAARYSSMHESRTLFVSEHADAVKKQHPDNARLQYLSDDACAIVSEPIGLLTDMWDPIPESSAVIVDDGGRSTRDFIPRVPA